MATQTAGFPRRRQPPRLPRTAGELLTVLAGTHAAALDRARNIIATRTPRPRLAQIAVPLGICAAVLSGALWIVVPLAGIAWWWLADDWDWAWLGAVGRGVIAVEWAAMGANGLAEFPESTAVVSAVWIGAALVLGLVGHRRETR
jgi:hypothetical protein